jgi:hypothetical protein
MAKPRINIGPPSVFTRTELYDPDGRLFMRIGFNAYFVRNGVGDLEQHRISENILLMDGSYWNPSMLLTKPPVLIGTCLLCRDPPFVGLSRDPPRHGIVALGRAKTCASCSALCCPRHFKKCPGGKYLCLPCARKSQVKGWIRRLFFTSSED